jgi:hypothetical protein
MKITEFKVGDKVSFLAYKNLGGGRVSANRHRSTGVVTATAVGHRSAGIQVVAIDGDVPIRTLYANDGVKLV